MPHAPTVPAPDAFDRRALVSVALGVAATVVYLLLCHWALAQHSAWAPWLMLAPVSASLVGAAAMRYGRGAGLAAVAAIVIALALLQPWMLAHGAWLYVAEHAGFQLALASLFGFSLADPRGPLITRLARHVRGEALPASVVVYTRRITQMWAAVFVAIAATSVALFAFAPIAWWSTFANLITMPLVVLLFIGEYVVRRIVLRDIDHSRLMDGVRAFRAHQGQGGGTGPR